MQAKREAMAEIDRENTEFSVKYQAKVAEKDTLRQQICEVEHILRLLRLEIEQTQMDTKRVQIVAEKEDDLAAKKQLEEKRIIKLVNEDVKDQIRSLEEQLNVAQATQVKQEEIEKKLKAHYERASKDLDLALQEALKKKAQQVQDLGKLQQDVLQKRAENEVTRSKNVEMQHELEVLEKYAAQL